jgi:tetratricopeptide (TPR) repeat protein
MQRGFLPSTAAEMKALTRNEMIAILRDLRQRPVHAPSLVFWCGMHVLVECPAALGNDLYNVYEQVLIAALECNNTQKAEWCLAALIKKFGVKESLRLRRLAGMMQEANDDFEKAMQIYRSILSEAPGDQFCVRRMSAMCKSRGDIEGAIKVLESNDVYSSKDVKASTYLDLHTCDVVVYRELYALYLELWRLDKASYYSEEVILHEPHVFINYTRHGEVLASAGHTERAIQAFSHSLELNSGANNVRALYGLWAVVLQELQSKKQTDRAGNAVAPSTSAASNSTKSLFTWCGTKLRALYAGSPQEPKVDLMLQIRV